MLCAGRPREFFQAKNVEQITSRKTVQNVENISPPSDLSMGFPSSIILTQLNASELLRSADLKHWSTLQGAA